MLKALRPALPLALGLALANGHAAHAIDDFFPEFGNNGYDVQHYDLTLAIDPDEQRIETGKAVLTVRATARLASFTLDLAGLEVSRVAVDGTGALFSREDGKLRIQPAKQIAKGKRFTVEVDYAGEPEGIDDPTSDDPTSCRWAGSPTRTSPTR